MSEIDFLLVGFLAGFIIMGILLLGFQSNKTILDKQTANDVCKNITGNNNSIVNNVGDYKLHCQLPSFDSTQNIIIDLNNNKGGN